MATGCANDIATLQNLINSLPTDPRCTSVSNGKTTHQIILAPDPHLDSTFAMVSWGWSLKTNCLDTAAMHAFYNVHTNRATEDLCNAGIDYSAKNWCKEPQVGILSKKYLEAKESNCGVSLKTPNSQRSGSMTFEILNGGSREFYNSAGKREGELGTTRP